MSQTVEASVEKECEFTWGIKRGMGGKKKEVQFYESFTYDGIEYFLYDNVYLYNSGEPEPYIGKLVKIWEQPQQIKKVKVIWFFRPVEILNWIGDDSAVENELFLASGDGVGLANINPLESVSGKCHVVCTSKDSRNPQPSPEEVEMADHIFYRTFNVGKFTLSDKIDDKIAGVEVKNLLNKSRVPESRAAKHNPKNNQNGNAMTRNEESQLCPKLNSPGTFVSITVDAMAGHLAQKDDKDMKVSFVKQKPLSGGNHVADLHIEIKETAAPAVIKEQVSSHEETLPRPTADSCNNEIKTSSTSMSKVDDKKLKSSNDLGMMDDRPSKKARLDSPVKLPGESTLSPSLAVNKVRNVDSPVKLLEEPSNSPSLAVNEDKNGNSSVKLPEEPSSPSSLAVNKGKNGNSLLKKQTAKTDEGDVLHTSGTAGGAFESKAKSNYVRRLEKGSHEKVKLAKKTFKPSNGTMHKTSAVQSQEKNIKAEGQLLEVTRRPDADRSKWFPGLPWEDRMEAAHKQGRLVLLENLDPTYSSSEIEDIVWSGFREICTAKIVPYTSISSPHSGQAFVIFNSRDAADTAVTKLEEGCLMLPNGRPLVASWGSPPSSEKRATFAGHFCVDKFKLLQQREAISTSHCSQPNTIEYDMAMEWRLLQTKCERMWKELYKQHGDELKKMKATLKSN